MIRLLVPLAACIAFSAGAVVADSWKDESGMRIPDERVDADDRGRGPPPDRQRGPRRADALEARHYVEQPDRVAGLPGDRDFERDAERRHLEHRDDSWFHRNGYAQLDIPAGHYPPPGECRVWLPGRPPGQQPPPGDCTRLQYEVPAGGWLIGHPGSDPGRVEVAVYDQPPPTGYRDDRAPLVIGEFDIASGVLGRVLADERPFFHRD